jgi:DamX protein
MENTSQPTTPEESNAVDLALGERINALERQMAEQSSRVVPAGAPLQQAELSEELERHRDQLRDYEKALVERIADVDDDRRATALRLQRAWQTQREEVDDRLRRHAGLVSGVLLLFAVLVAVALYFVYRQATTGQPHVAEEVVEMRQVLDRISRDTMSGEQVKGELTRLSADVEGILMSLDRPDKDDGRIDSTAVALERRAREEGEERVAGQIRRLHAERARLAEDVESLRAALRVAEAARAAQPAAAAPAAVESASDPAGSGSGGDADPSVGALTTAPGSAGGEEGALPVAADEVAVSEIQGGEGPTSADEDAIALGSEDTIVVGEKSYALQLIGFFNRDSLAAFAAREALPARIFYIRQTHKGRPWYALVHSLHEGYAAAVEELSRLPEDLTALNPWIRPVPEGTKLRVLKARPGQ